MKQRRIRRTGLILTLCAAMLAGPSVTAFAQMDDTGDSGATIEESLSSGADTGTGTKQADSGAGVSQTDSGTGAGQAENSTGEEPSDAGQAQGGTPQVITPGSAGASSVAGLTPSVNLTPSGNMDLVDDLEEEAAQDMQFLTVKSRNGSYFYIVIDRSGNTQNVYFLNEVDASDLMALMSDEEKAQFVQQEPAEEEKEESKEDLFSISTPDTAKEETGSEPEDPNDVQGEVVTEEPEDTAQEEEKTGSQLPILLFVGILAALIIGGYYMLKIRPKKEGGYGDDLEFEDDEEYGQEDDGEEELDDLF